MKPKYVIYSNRKWKRSTSTTSKANRWDKFSLAHVYRARGWAELAIKSIGKGTIMEQKETAKETLKNWRETK